MDWKEFVQVTELLSEIPQQYFAEEAEQKRHRTAFFQKMWRGK